MNIGRIRCQYVLAGSSVGCNVLLVATLFHPCMVWSMSVGVALSSCFQIQQCMWALSAFGWKYSVIGADTYVGFCQYNEEEEEEEEEEEQTSALVRKQCMLCCFPFPHLWTNIRHCCIFFISVLCSYKCSIYSWTAPGKSAPLFSSSNSWRPAWSTFMI